MRTKTFSRSRQRGAVLAAAGLFMVVLTGMAALGVDAGRLAFTANEAQTVADAAALAYAKTMLDNKVNETNNSPFVAADLVVDDNYVDGKAASNAAVEYAVGRFDFDSRQFRPGGYPPNAVQASATTTVTNGFAGVFGHKQSTVKRSAVAAMGAATKGRPTLPIALGDCHFPRRCQDESCLPTLRQAPNGDDNSGYTGFFGGASNSDVSAYLSQDCGGGGSEIPSVGVGDHISLNNGQMTSVLTKLECMVCRRGITEFTVPVVANCEETFASASAPGTGGSPDGVVYGFASITIDSFNYANGGKGCDLPSAPKSVNLHAVTRDDDGFTGAGGPCEGCLLNRIALVR